MFSHPERFAAFKFKKILLNERRVTCFLSCLLSVLKSTPKKVFINALVHVTAKAFPGKTSKQETKEKEGNGILCVFNFPKEVLFYSRECTLLFNTSQLL